ncbi:MAG: restriction endonuclease subunit S [Chromatiales bacterium]|nr:restriction endonuclease subunit S [Chromatiales bacterium]
MSFPEVPISGLVERCLTWNPRSCDCAEFDYIDLSSVDKDAKRITTVETYACAEAPSRARQIVQTGDILVSTVRPNLNGVAAVGPEHDGLTASTGYCVLRPDAQCLDSSFLFHWVKTEKFIQRMVDLATGANYPAVSDAKVKASIIPLAPLAEQKRIAGILDTADALRAKRRESLAQLDNLLQSTFLDLFGDPRREGTMGKVETRSANLGDLTSIRTGKLDANAADENGAYPFFTCATRTLRINTPAFDGKAVLVAGNGDLNVKYYEGKFNAYQRTYVIESRNEAQLHPRFLHIFLDLYVSELRKMAIGGVIKYIKLPYLQDAKVELPAREQQAKFAAIVETVERQKALLVDHLAELDKLFTSLQSRAFNGEL